MIEPFPEHWQLISFFESEPAEDRSVPVTFRELTFRCPVSDQERVDVAIDRASEAVLIVWYRSDEESLRLHLHWVSSMIIDTTKEEELVLTFKDKNLDALRFRIRPTVHLAWGTKMYP